MQARQLQKDDFDSFHYMIAMDSSNLQNISKSITDDARCEVKLLTDFIPNHKGSDVPDPYYTGNFDEVYELVNECCERLLVYICEKENVN